MAEPSVEIWKYGPPSAFAHSEYTLFENVSLVEEYNKNGCNLPGVADIGARIWAAMESAQSVVHRT